MPLLPLAQPKILIVDDNKVNVELIRAQLKPFDYLLQAAYDGEEALAKIHRDPPDLILLDLMMPKVSGYEVCRAIKHDEETQFIPVIVITALQELDDKLKAIELGADDFLVKPFNKIELTTRIRSLLQIKALHDDLERSEDVLFSLVRAMEAKDPYTRGHSERVATAACRLGKTISLGDRDLEYLRRGALIHDIGKIGIGEAILKKPDKLTSEEMAEIRSHPQRGYEICFPLRSLRPVLPCIRSHHERWDGTGYPDGLAGDDIPLFGQLVAISDAFDAITTDRPYRKGRTREEAIGLLERELESGQWNPTLLRAFLDLLRQGVL
ncbi:MAG: response regulator [Deltaproteobacteria bacterium]|nr:response regulator [Deltaproteobacteria bacterium]